VLLETVALTPSDLVGEFRLDLRTRLTVESDFEK
jgi:hypothetical protein